MGGESARGCAIEVRPEPLAKASQDRRSLASGPFDSIYHGDTISGKWSDRLFDLFADAIPRSDVCEPRSAPRMPWNHEPLLLAFALLGITRTEGLVQRQANEDHEARFGEHIWKRRLAAALRWENSSPTLPKSNVQEFQFFLGVRSVVQANKKARTLVRSSELITRR